MFNKETEYALRGLVYIQSQNNKGLRPGIDEITREIDAPRFYTAKILQRLVRLRVLNSLKGKGGGFYFDGEKPEITLKELIVAIEGDRTFTGCGFGLNQCDCENPCPMHDQYAVIRSAMDKMVSTETIQTLARKEISKSQQII